MVLEESFTRAEKTLLNAVSARRSSKSAGASGSRWHKFTDVVEQATGRKVRVFLSETDIEHDVSVETFLLADDERLD